MDIKDIEVLIECKRLVERMLAEKKLTLDNLTRSAISIRHSQTKRHVLITLKSYYGQMESYHLTIKVLKYIVEVTDCIVVKIRAKARNMED